MTTDRSLAAPDGQQIITFTREFAAPAALVFRAHVDEALIPQWIGPVGTTVRMRHWDARTGGSWSYVVEAGENGSWAFFGSFHEVTPATRLVQTFEFEGEPGHPNLDILVFEDLPGGRCLLRGVGAFPSVAERDAMMADMEQGRDSDFERLDALLPTLR